MQNSKVQNYFAQIVMKQLTENLKTKVSVGSVEYRFFNRFTLKQLYVEDLDQDTLLYVEEINANFDFWNFFRAKIIFNSFECNTLYANLNINESGISNFQFILDALKTPANKDSSSSNLEYRIDEFKLINSKVIFKNHKLYKPRSADLFNENDLKFDSIQADISLNVLTKDSLNGMVNHLSAVEKSGFVLKNFAASIEASDHGALLPSFILELPNSKLTLDNIELKFDSLADLKKMGEKLRWKVPIQSSYLSFRDLSAFVPNFKNVSGTATLKGNVSGRISSLKFQDIEMRYGKSIVLNTDLEISGLPKLSDAFVYGQINTLQFKKGDLQDLLSNIQRKPVILPKEITQLGLITYKGNVTGFFSDMVVYGNLSTDIGSISTDILLKFTREMKDLVYNGTIRSKSLDLAKLLANKNLGKVSFSLNTKGEKKELSDLKGDVKSVVSEFQLNKYSYKDLQFNGKYDGNGFDGRLDIDDPNLYAHFTGLVDLRQEKPIFDLDLKVRNLDLHALNLIHNYPQAKLSFNGTTNLVGNTLENIDGYVLFDSIRFQNKNMVLNVNEIQVVSRTQPNFTHLGISSDYVNGTITGDFKYNSIGKSIHKIIETYLPSLAANSPNIKGNYLNHFDLDLRLSNTQEISKVFELPFSIDGVSLVRGSIDEKSNHIDLIAICPSLKAKNLQFTDISLHFGNPNDKLTLNSRGQLIQKDGSTEIFLDAFAQDDKVSTLVGWQNTQKIVNAGEFQTLTHFSEESGKTAAKISIFPTQLVINDSTWNIRPSEIELRADSSIYVNEFKLDNNNQFIYINGIASRNREDALKLKMKELNLEFVMSLLKLKGIKIGGEATGEATISGVLKQPIFEADINVKHATLNNKEIANVAIKSTWDGDKKLVLLGADFVDNNSQRVATADGIFSPSADSLDVMFDAKKLSIEFLSPYFESVAQNFKGFGSGKLRMFGPTKKIAFEGNVFVENGQASMKLLGTKYFFSDTIRLSTKKIEIRNLKVTDEEKNFGFVQGDINHNGQFQQMKYDISMRSKNIMALNTKAPDNEYFYGKAYVDGTVRIFGNDKEASILVNVVSQPKTKCYIQMGGASKASDNSFIRFVDTKADLPKQGEKPKSSVGAFNTKVNLQIDVNQNAEMELIVSPKEGDMIAGRGSGNLRVEFDTFSDIKLYGTYTIDNGFYLFTLQNVIRKEFKIDRGSTMSWTGSPFNAQVNIRALYSVTASLRDLMEESELAQNNSTTVPVNCVLKLTDNLMKPNIQFDIELPSSEPPVKQRVKAIVNTEQMMNQQILSLLVMSRFFKPDYLRSSSTTSNFASNEGVSILTTTLSSQLNRWIQQSLNSTNLSFGLDMNTTDLNSEYKAQVFYQPSNRLIVNGNFGYRNDNINTTNTNRFIGDVDVEYLLSESGRYRFKAYNHSVDRYQLRTARTTQGIGLMYKEEFATMNDLFSYYWRTLTTIGNKKNEKDSILIEP